MNNVEAMIQAIEADDAPLVAELLSNKSMVNHNITYEFPCWGLNGQCTLLHLSAFLGRVNIITKLVSTGARVDARTEKGHTPLYFAVANVQVSSAKTLLEQGASCESDFSDLAFRAINRLGLVRASEADTAEILRLLISAAGSERKDVLDRLSTLLFDATEDRGMAVVQCLLDHGADINVRVSRSCIGEQTALHAAIDSRIDTAEKITLLLDRGIDLNARDAYGRTALHKAAFGDSKVRCVELLLESNADVFIKDNDGYTAYDIARSKGAFEISERLRVHAGIKESSSDEFFESLGRIWRKLWSQDKYARAIVRLKFRDIGGRSGIRQPDNLIRIRLFGQEVYDRWGMDGMRIVWEKARAVFGGGRTDLMTKVACDTFGSELEMAWNNVGEWRA